MEVVSYKTPVERVDEIGERIGSALKGAIENGKYREACSDLIHTGIVHVLWYTARKLNAPVSKTVSNRTYVWWWIGAQPAMRALLKAIPQWGELDMRIAMGAPILRSEQKEADNVPADIASRIYLFVMFAIWYGASADSKRRLLNNKETIVLQKAMKAMGVRGILTQLWMGVTQFVCLSEKIYLPAWERMCRGADERTMGEIVRECEQPTNDRVKVANGFGQLKNLLEGKT